MVQDVVVVGASAGGLPALQTVVRSLPATFQGAVLVVVHMRTHDDSQLPQVLQRECKLQVRFAQDGEPVTPGRVYVSRPDHHLFLDGETIRLTRGPKENRFRPAIDVLFRSAAYSMGPRVVGVVLSGALDDGSAGLWWIKERGGDAVVQSTDEAEFPSMPANALHYVDTQHVLTAKDIGPFLVERSRTRVVEESKTTTAQLALECSVAQEVNALREGIMELGTLTPFTCPECRGVLLKMKEGRPTTFRCHTGHAYSVQALLSELEASVEESVWSSIRSMEEVVMLLGHLSEHLRDLDPAKAERCRKRQAAISRQTDVLRSLATGATDA